MAEADPQDADTLQGCLARMAGYGDATALAIYGEEGRTDVSFRDLLQRARRVANGLPGEGIGQLTPVALFGTNSLDWVVCRFALIEADALCVPIDFDAEPQRLHDLMADSGARHVFATADRLPTVRKALETLGEDAKVYVLDSGGERPEGATPLAEIASDTDVALPKADPDAPAAQFYTSGTTGAPKAVPLTNRNLLINVRILLELDLVGPGDTVLLPLPLHHSYPFLVGLTLPLVAGATVVFPAGVSGPNLIRALQDSGVTAIVGVPRLYDALASGIANRVRGQGLVVGGILGGLMAVSRSLRRRLGIRAGRWLLAPLHKRLGPRLRLLVSGGARLDERVAWRLESLGYQVLSGYGLVETTSVATFNPPGKAKLGSGGKPSRAVEMRIRPVEGMDYGEIQFRGDIVFRGYENNPDANAEAFTEDGWFRTGDLGERDADGYVYIRGRLKEMIVLPGGKNVAPEDIERVYAEAPVIREIAVLERDERLVGLVVPDLTAEDSLGKIENQVRVALGERGQRLPGYMRLADFALTREELPRNQLGKYKRHQLGPIYDRAERGEGGEPRALSEEEKERLATPRARETIALLAERYPERTIHPDTSLQMELGIDSLSWVELSLDIERRLGVSLDDEAVAEVSTVGELVAAVEGSEERSGEREAREARLLQTRDRWLAPRTATETAAGWALYGVAALLGKTLFPTRVAGREHLPADGPFIVAANHVSDLDPGVLAVALPNRVFRMTWWSGDSGRLFSNKLQRGFSRAMHIFPVDARAPGATLDMAAEVLHRDQVLAWFPEEWRSPDGGLQPFRPGIGALIDRTRAPVVPCYIAGPFEAMPRTARLPKPTRMAVRFGPPIEAEELLPDDDDLPDSERHRTIARNLRTAVAALEEPARRDREG